MLLKLMELWGLTWGALRLISSHNFINFDMGSRLQEQEALRLAQLQELREMEMEEDRLRKEKMERELQVPVL